MRITISTIQKKDENGKKNRIDPYLRSSLNETTNQSKSASKYQGRPLLRLFEDPKKSEKGNILR